MSHAGLEPESWQEGRRGAGVGVRGAGILRETGQEGFSPERGNPVAFRSQRRTNCSRAGEDTGPGSPFAPTADPLSTSRPPHH